MKMTLVLMMLLHSLLVKLGQRKCVVSKQKLTRKHLGRSDILVLDTFAIQPL